MLSSIYIGKRDIKVDSIRSSLITIAKNVFHAFHLLNRTIPNAAAYLILQRHDRVIFGCIDM